MNSRWFAHLDAHIATGQVAVEAESAEILSELLQLEPEQRWCLVLNRDPRLTRLVAVDYRRLLTLMVELEAGAIADAPIPPLPCIETLSKPLALPHLKPPSSGRARRIAWSLGVLLLALTSAAGGIWLLGEDGHRHLARLVQESGAWWPTWGGTRAARDEELARRVADSLRQQQDMATFVVLETLSNKLAEGQPFADELTALKRLWPDPAQLAFLDQLSTLDPAEPVALRAELTRLSADVTRQRDELVRSARLGRLARSDYQGRMQPLETLRAQADKALTRTVQGDWRASLDALRDVRDPAYRSWSARVQRWLTAREAVSDLVRQAWSQWTSGPPDLVKAPPP